MRRWLILIGVGAAAIAGGAIFWFQPQKLVIEEKVFETARPSASVGGVDGVERRGSFESLEHTTTGTAVLAGSVLRFENLNTSNGPDLRVYLSKRPAGLGWRDYGEEFIELGKLKGNIGDQNYDVPAGLDLSVFKSVVIWCVRFAVGFGVAPLRA